MMQTTMGTHSTMLMEPMPSEPTVGMAARASEMGPMVISRGMAMPSSISSEVQLSWKDWPRGLIWSAGTGRTSYLRAYSQTRTRR